MPTIKNGVSLLKKHNLIFVFSLFLITTVVCGCKSTPTSVVVNPLDLLDENSAFYIAVPSQADPELGIRVIQNNIPNLTEQDAKKIFERINKIYAGITRTKRTTEIQAVADGNIPVKYMPKILSSKNGWKNVTYSPNNSSDEYKVYMYNQMDLAFPSNNIACFGRDIYSVIDKYDYIKKSSNSLEEQTSLQNYSSLPQHLYSWLEGAENEIRFYAVKPQSFLTILTGSNLDLKLFDVQGAFFTDENFPSQYVLDITFNFKNSKYLKAGKTLLTLAFGLTDSQSITINDNSLEIKGIKISKEQLYKLLIL